MAKEKVRAKPGGIPADFGEYADWNRDVILWLIEQGADPVDLAMDACGAAAGITRNFITHPKQDDLGVLRDGLTLVTKAIYECLIDAARRTASKAQTKAATRKAAAAPPQRRRSAPANRKGVKPEARKGRPQATRRERRGGGRSPYVRRGDRARGR